MSTLITRMKIGLNLYLESLKSVLALRQTGGVCVLSEQALWEHMAWEAQFSLDIKPGWVKPCYLVFIHVESDAVLERQ